MTNRAARSNATTPRQGMFLAGAFALLLACLPTTVFAQAGGGCDIEALASVAFGAYDPMGAHLSAPLDSAGSISVFCRGHVTALTITIDQGMTPAAGSTCGNPQRQMASGPGRLRYDIYQDPGRTQPWGCQASTAMRPPLSGGSNRLTIPIHGRIPAGQDPASGSYADTMVITLTF